MPGLVKGQNAPLPTPRIQVRLSVPGPADVCALVLDHQGKVLSENDFVFYNNPAAAGVRLAGPGVELDLAAVPVPADRVICAFSVDADQPPLGLGAAPVGVALDASGAELFQFVLAGLATERAVIAFEFYRRGAQWKIRAVGQGYDGGLAALVRAHGLDVEDEPVNAGPAMAPTEPAAPPPPRARPRPIPDPGPLPGPAAATPPGPAAPAPPGTSDLERQFRVLTSIFEDAARSAAGYRSAVGYAEQRRERELGDVLDDPRRREQSSPGGTAAQQRYAELVGRATADHRRDVDALAQELQRLTPQLPAALAPWDSPSWRSGPFGRSVGIRAGDLHLPEAPDLRIPLLLSTPLRRPLWLHQGVPGPADPRDAGLTAPATGTLADMARAMVMRLLAADPDLGLQLCDPDGTLTNALGELAAAGSGLLAAPVARTRQDRTETLRALVERVDLIEMARDAGALDSLPMGDTAVLLVLADVPFGFDETDHRRLRYLVEHGPGAGVQLVLLGDPDDAGPAAEVARSALRLGATTDNGISDGWVGLDWTFTPDFGPSNPASIVFRS